MKQGLVLLLFFSLFLSSCAKSPTLRHEPTSADDTLLIGRILFHCQSTKVGSIPIGKYRYNVRLELEDEESGKTIKIRTVNSKGFFYIHNPPFSKFHIKRLSYEQYYAQPDYHKKSKSKKSGKKKTKKTEKGKKKARSAVVLNNPNSYQLQKAKVNNMGYILWVGDMNSRKHDITTNQEYEETRAAFLELYPESLWNKKDWLKMYSK